MPQLKIADVKKQVEDLETSLNAKFASLVEEVKEVLKNSGVGGSDEAIAELEKKLGNKIEGLRNDVGGHVRIYNKHIQQQHAPKGNRR
jgi:ElaB/YqjD/DUF883 family membrane-anchored ribosome-binding protein